MGLACSFPSRVALTGFGLRTCQSYSQVGRHSFSVLWDYLYNGAWAQLYVVRPFYFHDQNALNYLKPLAISNFNGLE